MSLPAKTQALEALVEAHARELHLPAIRARFRQLAAEATREQQTPLAYLAALLEAEMQERAERRERRRLLDARFPLIKRLEDFHFQDNPKVPQATIAALAEGAWIDDRESIIFIGESGTGKDDARHSAGGVRLPARPARAVHHPRRLGDRWRRGAVGLDRHLALGRRAHGALVSAVSPRSAWSRGFRAGGIIG
jgi:hypothetical protein